MSATPKKNDAKDVLRSVLENPARLRVVLTVLLLSVWYLAIFSPLSGDIETRRTSLQREQDRLELAKAVDLLRQEASRVDKRLPVDADQNEWIQFLMEVVRKLPLKLVSLEPKAPTDVGPFKLLTFRLAVEGKYQDLESLLRDLETSPRLLRIEQIKMLPKNVSVDPKAETVPPLELQMVILGLTQPIEPDKEVPKKERSPKP